MTEREAAAARATRARALRLHCLRHDVVEGAGRGSSTLLSGVLFGLLAASIVAGIAEDDPTLLFALLGLFALVDLLGDVATAFLDPRDVPLLHALPVADGEYVRARLAALLVPVTVKTAALAIPATAALLGAGTGIWRALSFAVAFALLAAALAGVSVLLLLAVRRALPGVRLDVALAWLRALLLVGATGGWLLLLRAPAEAAGERAARSLADSAVLPTAWFAEVELLLRGAAGIRWERVAAAAALLAVAIGGVVVLARGYVRLLEGLAATPSARKRGAPPWRRAFERWFVAAEERPAFRLGLAVLRRERTFRLQTLPLLAYPLLFLALGRGADDQGLFALLFAQLPALALALSCLLLRYSDSPQGGFVLRFFAGGRERALEGGARKALWYAVALPLSLLVAALLAWDRGALFAAAVGGVGLLSSTIAVVTLRPPQPELPFADRFRGRLESGEGGRIFGLLLMVVAAAAIEWRLVRVGPPGLVGLAAGALAATCVLLRRRPSARPPPSRPDAADRPELADAPTPAEALASAVPFPVRLRRELRGVAVFFALAGAALTFFFAWV